ncbi:MAG: type II toxin-antitoxin system VapC family toxin [Cyanobacteria bacterium P01_F01_bin.150]
MTILPILLDTDILSNIMRQNPAVMPKAQGYLAIHQSFTFSLMTRYEILRGLKAKQARRQLAAFEQLCQVSNILPLTDEVVIKASDIYAALKQRGELIGDADILIASTALTNGLSVATNNFNHFQRIPDLQIENWLD